MLRRSLLYLSTHSGLRHWIETSSPARRLSARFIAGDNLESALTVCSRIRKEGISATLDYLGENVRSIEEASACRDVYLKMLRSMRDAGLEPNVSLKLTQFGLDLSPEACEANVAKLVEAAAGMTGFVRIDMESTPYKKPTLEIVKRLHERYRHCGTVIQAYLFESQADIQELNRRRIRVRLCKGAYLEPPTVAFSSKKEVDENYLKLAELLLNQGEYPAIATHDARIIESVRAFASRKGIAPDRFEFQMLYGIRRDLQRKLVQGGYRLRLYIPFGEAWYPYFMRRLAERPANLLFLARNLFRS
jgi:proline dehydrogenase